MDPSQPLDPFVLFTIGAVCSEYPGFVSVIQTLHTEESRLKAAQSLSETLKTALDDLPNLVWVCSQPMRDVVTL